MGDLDKQLQQSKDNSVFYRTSNDLLNSKSTKGYIKSQSNSKELKGNDQGNGLNVSSNKSSYDDLINKMIAPSKIQTAMNILLDK